MNTHENKNKIMEDYDKTVLDRKCDYNDFFEHNHRKIDEHYDDSHEIKTIKIRKVLESESFEDISNFIVSEDINVKDLFIYGGGQLATGHFEYLLFKEYENGEFNNCVKKITTYLDPFNLVDLFEYPIINGFSDDISKNMIEKLVELYLLDNLNCVYLNQSKINRMVYSKLFYYNFNKNGNFGNSKLCSYAKTMNEVSNNKLISDLIFDIIDLDQLGYRLKMYRPSNNDGEPPEFKITIDNSRLIDLFELIKCDGPIELYLVCKSVEIMEKSGDDVFFYSHLINKYGGKIEKRGYEYFFKHYIYKYHFKETFKYIDFNESGTNILIKLVEDNRLSYLRTLLTFENIKNINLDVKDQNGFNLFGRLASKIGSEHRQQIIVILNVIVDSLSQDENNRLFSLSENLNMDIFTNDIMALFLSGSVLGVSMSKDLFTNPIKKKYYGILNYLIKNNSSNLVKIILKHISDNQMYILTKETHEELDIFRKIIDDNIIVDSSVVPIILDIIDGIISSSELNEFNIPSVNKLYSYKSSSVILNSELNKPTSSIVDLNTTCEYLETFSDLLNHFIKSENGLDMSKLQVRQILTKLLKNVNDSKNLEISSSLTKIKESVWNSMDNSKPIFEDFYLLDYFISKNMYDGINYLILNGDIQNGRILKRNVIKLYSKLINKYNLLYSEQLSDFVSNNEQPMRNTCNVVYPKLKSKLYEPPVKHNFGVYYEKSSKCVRSDYDYDGYCDYNNYSYFKPMEILKNDEIPKNDENDEIIEKLLKEFLSMINLNEELLEGKTLLSNAATEDSSKMLKFLLELKSNNKIDFNINYQLSSSGDTALSLALSNKKWNNCDILLQNGACPKIRNNAGISPNFCKDYEWKEILDKNAVKTGWF